MTKKENIMGTKPVGKLLIGMAFPIMCSMLVQALYNIVDSAFVSELGQNALNAVNLVFPIQNLMIAVSVGTAVGVNAVLSRKLGQKDYDGANEIANLSIFLSVINGLIFAVFGQLFSGRFMSFFTDVPEIAQNGEIYMKICTAMSFAVFLEIMFERLIQVTGKTIYQMIIQMTGAIVNIILDPILIFGLLGFPKMGVKGAAIATVIGQMTGMTLGFIINYIKNHEVRLSKLIFKPRLKPIIEIYRIGFPAILMQSIGSVLILFMNKILITLDDGAVWVFGVFFKLQSFVFMPVFGITNALIPIVGYNYGAEYKKRIIKTIKIASSVAFMIMALGTVIFWTVPSQLLGLFHPTENLIAIGVPALRILSICYIFAGINIVASSSFQALGEGMASLMMSIIRQLVVILPIAYILAKTMGLPAVWFAMPIAELACTALTVIYYKKVYNKKIKSMPDI